ncbi:WH2 domain-containing protein [Entamoeba marina]
MSKSTPIHHIYLQPTEQLNHIQITEALDNLSKYSTNTTNSLSQSIQNITTRLQSLQKRANALQTSLSTITGTNHALTVFAPPKCPSLQSTPIIFHKSSQPTNTNNPTTIPPNPYQSSFPFHSISSALLFGTGSNIYSNSSISEKTQISNNINSPLSNSSPEPEDELFDPLSSLLSNETAFRYRPTIDKLPEFNLPTTLPNLPNVADLPFVTPSNILSIAPSVDLPDIPFDLPDDEHSLTDDDIPAPPPPPPTLSPPSPPPKTTTDNTSTTTSTTTNKTTSTPPPEPTASTQQSKDPGISGLLEQIRNGTKLKKVTKDENNKPIASKTKVNEKPPNENNLMEALALKLKTMRTASNYDLEEEEDSGEWL